MFWLTTSRPMNYVCITFLVVPEIWAFNQPTKQILQLYILHYKYRYKYFSETDKQVYEACIGVASTLLAPAQLRMAKLALSMHLTSPTVRMFDQIATQSGAKEVTCDSFVSIASRKICDNDALKDILKSYNQYDVVSVQILLLIFFHV